MKKDIHPECHNITVRCFCGNSIETTSTSNKIDVDICSNCHPFFTGTQKFVDTAGRIEKFQRRYTPDSTTKKEKAAKPAEKPVEKKVEAEVKAVTTETKKAAEAKAVEPKVAAPKASVAQEPKATAKKTKKSK